MGWTFVEVSLTPSQRRLWLDRELCGVSGPVASAMVGSTYYAAIRSDSGEVYGLVALTQASPREIGYKEMDEFMGPDADNCPAHILRELTDLDYLAGVHDLSGEPVEWARDWRRRCWAHYGGEHVGELIPADGLSRDD